MKKNDANSRQEVVNKRKINKKKVLIIVLSILAFFLISNTIATKIIYDSIFKRYDKDALNEETKTRYADVIESRQTVEIEGDDTKNGNADLLAYYVDVLDEKGLVMIAPGLHAGANHYLAMTESLQNEGYDVLSFDPTGTIGSEGKSCVGFSQEIYDLERVIEYARDNFSYKKLYLIGHSRGGFAVTAVADMDYDIDGIITIAGLNSAMEAVIGLSERYVGKVANANYFNLWAYQVFLFDKETMDKSADKILAQEDIPALIIQGSEDDTAPFDEYSIYSYKDEVDTEYTEFSLYTTDGQNGHTDIMFDNDGINANNELMEEITDFLDALSN